MTTHILILTDEQATAARAALPLIRDIVYGAYDDTIDAGLDALDNTLVAIPDEWADVQPASPLPWKATKFSVVPIDHPGGLGGAFVSCTEERDAAFIVASCNKRQALLADNARLKQDVVDVTMQRVEIKRLRNLVLEVEASRDEAHALAKRTGDKNIERGKRIAELEEEVADLKEDQSKWIEPGDL